MAKAMHKPPAQQSDLEIVFQGLKGFRSSYVILPNSGKDVRERLVDHVRDTLLEDKASNSL